MRLRNVNQVREPAMHLDGDPVTIASCNLTPPPVPGPIRHLV
jgi:hypothetical protein